MKFEDAIENMTFGKGVKWFFIAVTLLFAAGLVFKLLNTAFSVASAPGMVVQKTLQTDNIVHSYEWFYDVNASYEAKLGQIKQFKGFYSGEKDASEKSRLRVEMAAIQQTCRALTEKYNANSQKMNKSIFKGWSLPDYLSQQTCE